MSNETNGNGGPLWLRLLTQLGPVAAIAIGLVWFLTTQVIRNETAILRALEDHNRATIEQGFAQERRVEGLANIMRRICSNTAETAEERSLCFD